MTVRIRTLLLAASFLLSGDMPASAPAPASDRASLEVTVHLNRILEPNFLGFGVEWEYDFRLPDRNIGSAIWLRHWPEVLRRVAFMRPAILRVMLFPEDYSRLADGVTEPCLTTPSMAGMIRILDFAQQQGITVVLGVWSKPKWVSSLADPDWHERYLGPLIAHLRRDLGYRCIRFFNFINEPSGQKFTFDEWSQGILRLHATLVQHGLQQEVQLVGSDGPGDWNHWIRRIAESQQLRTIIGAYEYHLYAHLQTDKWVGGLLSGHLETSELAVRRRTVSEMDPDGRRKPFFMGEAGIDDGAKHDVQPNRYTFEFGVWMADYAAQSLRAGQAGLIAWYLDDAQHRGGRYGPLGLKGWGMWNSLAGHPGYPESDFDLRPWYYTWALICRNFPAGCRTVEVENSGDPEVRVAAAMVGEQDLTILVVSESHAPRSVAIRLQGSRVAPTLNVYRYFADDQPSDQWGFPVVSSRLEVGNSAMNIRVDLPNQGVIVLTSLAHERRRATAGGP